MLRNNREALRQAVRSDLRTSPSGCDEAMVRGQDALETALYTLPSGEALAAREGGSQKRSDLPAVAALRRCVNTMRVAQVIVTVVFVTFVLALLVIAIAKVIILIFGLPL